MHSYSLPYRDVTKHVFHRLMEFSDEAGGTLPFHRPEMSITWWNKFNSSDGEPFEKKRGRNFLGTQCWMNDLYYVISEDSKGICGAIPVVSNTIRMSKEQDLTRMLSFASDYVLAPYQDFLVSPLKRKETLSFLIQELMVLMTKGHQFVFLGYIPEKSDNIPVIDEILDEMSGDISCKKCITSQKGGVRPWTLKYLQKLFGNIVDKVGENLPGYKPVYELAGRLGECQPDTLLFPRDRKELEMSLWNIVSDYGHLDHLQEEMESIHSILSPSPIMYPFIDLPADRESYLHALGKKTRFNFRYYRKKILGMGGTIENVNSEEMTERDIENYLDLHMMRWGKRSVAITDKTRDFHMQLCSAMARQRCFTLFFIRLNGERIAAHACFDINDRREAYFTGINPDYDKFSAGMVLFLETILDAIDHHFTRYELGYGGDGYKFRFTGSSAKSYSYFIAEKGRMPDLDRIFTGYECMVECAPSTGAGIVCPKDSIGLC